METIKDKLLTGSTIFTYSLIGVETVFDFNLIKDATLWIGGIILLILQIRLYLIKIKNARGK